MLIPKPSHISQADWDEAWDEFNSKCRELHRMQEKIITELGYDTTAIYGNPPKTLLAPNGVTYNTSDDFHNGYGCMPCYLKDGVWYGMYEVIEKHNIPDSTEVSEKTRMTFGWFDEDLGI
jgi:hypothetical protein